MMRGSYVESNFTLKVSGLLLVLSLLLGCIPVTPTEQLISNTVNLSQDWLDLFPPMPLRSEQSQQQVFLAVDGIVALDIKSGIVTFDGGDQVNIEAEIIDEYGNKYELMPSGYGGQGGVYFARKSTLLQREYPEYSGEADFPDDRVYPEVRIRSDKEIIIDKVLWICSTNF